MEEKDKIIISTGHEPEEGLETPHFDAEETLLAARPVVPLTEEAIEAAHSRSSTRAEVAAPPLAKRIPMLARPGKWPGNRALPGSPKDGLSHGAAIFRDDDCGTAPQAEACGRARQNAVAFRPDGG